MDVETSNALDGLRSEVGTLRGEMHGIRDELRHEMHTMRSELRTHPDVVTESLRDDIRMLAESLLSLHAKVDRLSAR